MKVAPDNLDVFFLPGSPPISNDEICRKVCDETKRIGPIGLLIVDTSAAYFKGDDENSNAQLGDPANLVEPEGREAGREEKGNLRPHPEGP